MTFARKLDTAGNFTRGAEQGVIKAMNGDGDTRWTAPKCLPNCGWGSVPPADD